MKGLDYAMYGLCFLTDRLFLGNCNRVKHFHKCHKDLPFFVRVNKILEMFTPRTRLQKKEGNNVPLLE